MLSNNDRLVITAASRVYGPSLLALLGSLTLNWPQHPPVLVYDIGLDQTTLDTLRTHTIPVKQVPAFVPHWRRHFTWKPWCWHDAPARTVFWIDAGVTVLKPLDDVFEKTEESGYFVTTSGYPLEVEASEAACRGCGVPPEFRQGKKTLASTLVGLRKDGPVGAIVDEALAVAHTEAHMAATLTTHRHDQAVLSLLLYKYLGSVTIMDEDIYAGWQSPTWTPGQKIWVHRRRLRPKDQQRLARHISTPGPAFIPAPPSRLKDWLIDQWMRLRKTTPTQLIYDGVRD